MGTVALRGAALRLRRARLARNAAVGSFGAARSGVTLAGSLPSDIGLPPKGIEPVRGQFRVPDSVLDVPVSEIRLQTARIVSVVCQLVAGRVAQHMGMHLERQSRLGPGPRNQERKASRSERSAPFGHEDKIRMRRRLPLEPAQRPELI